MKQKEGKKVSEVQGTKDILQKVKEVLKKK